MYAASDILGTTALGSMKNVLILSLNNLVTPMKSDEYWQLRALQREADSHKDAASTALRLRALYERASKDLQKRIHKIFDAYVDYTGIDEQKAREFLSTQESAELLEELRKQYEETSNAEALAKLNVPAYGYRISRLQAARRVVEAELDKLATQEEKVGTGQLVDTYDKSYYKTAYDTLPELPETPVVPLSENVAEEAVQNKWDGKNYSERVWKNRDKLAQEAGRTIDSSAASGASIAQMTKELSDLMDVGSYVAARLIRTEVNRMHNNAALASYTAMGLKEYKYLATLDCRTCAVCGALDGKAFPITEAHTGVNFPPIHPNDRCTTVPKIPGVNGSDGSRAARNPETGRNYKVPVDMNYEEWRKSISEKYGTNGIQTAQKKYWNRKTDTEQMKAIRKVLGKDAPNNIADFQNLKYNDADRWEFVQLDYQRQARLLQHPELKLPNAEKATAADAKFEKYLFDGVHPEGLAKGVAFTSRLGYDINNWQNLRDEILNRASHYPATLKSSGKFGDNYEQKIIIPGSKGTPANVIVGWNVVGDVTKLTTAYIKEVK